MPPIKNSPHKTGKSMLSFTFEIPLFSVMSINSQIYMTKPKQAQKTLSENTEKTFSVIIPPFSSKGGGTITVHRTLNRIISRTFLAQFGLVFSFLIQLVLFLIKILNIYSDICDPTYIGNNESILILVSIYLSIYLSIYPVFCTYISDIQEFLKWMLAKERIIKTSDQGKNFGKKGAVK